MDNQILNQNNESLQNILDTVNSLPDASSGTEQAIPVISIDNSNGLITATAGTKTATKQLAFQAAQTITPGTVNQTIAANTYLGGIQTIKGDANLKAENIVNGKIIFGVEGTAIAGSGGDTSVEDSLITRTLTTYTNNRVSSIGSYTFYSCPSLTTVSFPVCTTIGTYAFYNCPSLTTVSFPVCTTIGSTAFYNCTSLTTVSFPVCTTIGSTAFHYCTSLTTVSFPVCTTIGTYAFYYCTKLTAFYLMGSSLCTLSNSNAFSKTAITSTTGSIFVPASLVASYKAATNWTYFSNRIFGV